MDRPVAQDVATDAAPEAGPDVDATASCVLATPCAGDGDCAGGSRCNLALTPPHCATLYCAAAGDPCHDNVLCTTGLVCSVRRVCAPPAMLTADARTNCDHGRYLGEESSECRSCRAPCREAAQRITLPSECTGLEHCNASDATCAQVLSCYAVQPNCIQRYSELWRCTYEECASQCGLMP